MKITSNKTLVKVLNFSQKNNLLEQNDNCLIAVSGGADSVCLLDIISKLKRLLKINFSIAHLNYNLRGQDSIDEQNFVKNLSNIYDVPFHLKSIILFDILRKKEASLENLARDIRYDFFEKLSFEFNYNKILVAHNANDQAETVVMKLMRGSVSGLKGMDLSREFSKLNSNLKVVRPILCLSRQEIESYCQNFELDYKTDLSNFENDFTRNRVRNNIIPLMLKENSNLFETIQKTCSVLSQEDTYLQNLALNIYKKICLKKEKNLVIISDSIKNEPEFLQRRIIKEIYEDLTEDKKSLSYKHLEAIKDCIEKNIGKKKIELGNNYFFTKEKKQLIFYKNNYTV